MTAKPPRETVTETERTREFAEFQKDVPDLPLGAHELMAMIVAMAHESLSNDGSLNPVAIITLENEAIVPIHPTGSFNPDAREDYSNLLRVVAAALPVRSIAFVSEGWMTIRNPGKGASNEVGEDASPEKSKDREEVILINCQWLDVTALAFCRILRNDDASYKALSSIEINPVARDSGADGRFMDLLPPAPLTQDARMLARTLLALMIGPEAVQRLVELSEAPPPTRH